MTREEAIKLFEEMESKEMYWQLQELCDLAIEALSEQVTSKLKNPCGSLLTEDSEDSKEQKSKLEPKRCKDCKWYKNCEYFDPHNAPCRLTHEIHTETHECVKETHDSDLISRADAITKFCEFGTDAERQGKTMMTMVDAKYAFIETLESMPSVAERCEDCEFWNDTEDGCAVRHNCNTEPSDLISRAKVLNVVQNADDGNIPYEVINDIIQGLPSVSAERVGEWIDRESCQVDEDSYDVAICSNCKAEITLEYPHDHYCPNCGARMENKK